MQMMVEADLERLAPAAPTVAGEAAARPSVG
jgi:hypothetical protein